MQRNCLKCHHVNDQATGDALEECPGCGAIYSRVEASMAARENSGRPALQKAHGEAKPLSPSVMVAMAAGGIALLLTAVYVVTQRAPTPAPAEPAASTVERVANPTPITRTSKAEPPQPTVAAETAPQESKIAPDEARRLCSSASQLAKSIMTARQNGVPMAQAMEFPAVTENEKARSIAHAMVIAAYEKPRYSTQGFIDTAVTDFENEMYLHCIKAM